MMVAAAGLAGSGLAGPGFAASRMNENNEGAAMNSLAMSAPAKPGAGLMVGDESMGAVARFVSPDAKGAEVASFALLKPLAKRADLPAGFATVPSFAVMADGKHQIKIATAAGTSLYGTGEVPGPLLRNGFSTTLWNTDAYGYDINTASLYQSHPWVLAVRADGTAFGVVVDTTWRATIDLTAGIEFRCEGQVPPVYILEGASPQAVMVTLGKMIGTMPLPPKWAIGYHQCRYSYFPESRVREVADEFRKRNIPASVLWFDIDYMDEYRVFSVDKKRFPDVAKLDGDLEAMGFKSIWMINPGVKVEKGASLSDDVSARGYEVKQKDGTAYQGNVWPGPCYFPDYTSHEVRAWWADLYPPFMKMGVDGVWNDMNEPAIFNVASKTMPEDNQHRGGTYTPVAGGVTSTVTAGDHARFHNVYGMLMAQATFEGIAKSNPEKRPFVLTRAGYLGSQRYAATWTGDNSATWTDLEQSIPMALQLGLSGQPFAGPDIGGFIGNGPGDAAEKADHFARWLGIGALLPFSRGHTAKGNIDKEPWSFGPEAESANRISLQRRYVLLPFFYTLFREASVTGMPVARPLFFADPKDLALRSEDDAFLIGDDVLVVPQLMPDRTRVVNTPKGIWRSFEIIAGPETTEFVAKGTIPQLYLRGGSILPTGPVMDWATQKPLDELVLYVSLDAKGQAKGMLYEDAGEGFGYQKGEYLVSRYSATSAGGKVTVKLESSEGGMARTPAGRKLTVKVVGDGGKLSTATGADGSEVVVSLGQ